MKTPNPNLRRIGNHSIQPVKAQVVIAPGDALEVSEDLAAQLQTASTAMRDGQPDTSWIPAEEPETTEEPVKKAAPRKRAAKKSGG